MIVLFKLRIFNPKICLWGHAIKSIFLILKIFQTCNMLLGVSVLKITFLDACDLVFSYIIKTLARERWTGEVSAYKWVPVFSVFNRLQDDETFFKRQKNWEIYLTFALAALICQSWWRGSIIAVITFADVANWKNLISLN